MTVPESEVVPGLETEDEHEIEFPQANIVAARVIGDAMATTLGPQALDKLVINQLATREEVPESIPETDDFVATSDGATILDRLPITHPVAPIIERIIGPKRKGDTDIEGQDIPDGITTTAVLLAELLDEAEPLLEQGVHPMDIIEGYQIGLDGATRVFERQSRSFDEFEDRQAIEEAVARTAMTGNLAGGDTSHWATLAAEAAQYIDVPNQYTFAVRQFPTGSIADSTFVRGAALDRSDIAHERMPTRAEDASVLVIGGYDRGGLQNPDMDGMGANIASPRDIEEIETVFQHRREEIMERIESVGTDVVVTELGIDPTYKQMLADRGIMAILGVTDTDLRQVVRATGATIVSDPMDISEGHLGTAGLVEERSIGRDRLREANRRMMYFEDCPNPESVAVVFRGVPDQIDEETTRLLRKGVSAVATADGRVSETGGVVPGGGAIDMAIAEELDDVASGVDSRAQLAVGAFARAVRGTVSTLVRNAGLDDYEVIAALRARRADGNQHAAWVHSAGVVDDAYDHGVVDPTPIRRRGYVAAVAVANLLLRIDDAMDATFSTEPAGPGDVINDEVAERHQEHVEENDTPMWG